MKRIEAEKDELVLRNESGDYAIIPADKRSEVKKLLSEGCYECIDKIVSELPAMADYANDGTVVSDPPAEFDPQGLLDYIGNLESLNKYDVRYGLIPVEGLYDMTISEVLDYQSTLEDSAMGKYQILRKTLNDLVVNSGVDPNLKFTPETQEMLGMTLLKRRGYDKYLKGKMTQEEFAQALSQEWAALPTKDNKTYYKNTKNKALTGYDEFMSYLGSSAPQQPEQPKKQPAAQPKVQPIKEVSQTLSYDDPIKLSEQLPMIQNMSNEMPAISQKYLQGKKDEPEITDKDLEYAKAIIARENKVKDKDLKYLPLQVLVKTLGKRNNKYSMLSNNPAFLSMLENKIKNGL